MARGSVLGCAVAVRARARGAAPPLLRARRRRVAGLPGAGSVRGARAVAGAGRRHRARQQSAPDPGPVAARGLGHPAQTTRRPARLFRTFRSAFEK